MSNSNVQYQRETLSGGNMCRTIRVEIIKFTTNRICQGTEMYRVDETVKIESSTRCSVKILKWTSTYKKDLL